MLKSLLGVRLGSLFASAARGKDGKTSTAKTVGVIVLAIFLVLSFAAMFLSVAVSLAFVLVPAGLDSYYFAIFNIITFAMVFVFSVFETKSELFECRDNELLLSMPIRPRDIVLSRSIAVILLNVGETLIVMIPAVIMYAVFGGSLLYVASALVTSVFVCLLATALASAVGYLVALVASKFKNKTLVSVLAYVIFLAAYFLGYEWLMKAVMLLEENPDAALGAIESGLGPISVLGEISVLSPIPTALFLLLSVGITLLAWFIISKNYVKIITDSKKSAKKKYKREKLVSGSLLTALVKKEMGVFTSSPTYILNGTAGVIFNVMLAVAAFPLKDALMSETAVLSMLGGVEFVYLAVAAMLSGMAFMNSISASAVSMEGKHWWITKSAPVPVRAMVYAKLAPHLIVALPISLVSSVVVAIALGAPAVWWVPMIGIPLLANVVSAVLGLILNIAFPKFEFTNDAQVVKQSLPVFITLMIGFAFVFGSAAIAVALTMVMSAAVSAAVIAVFYLVVFLILYLILTGPSERRLEML